MEQNELISKQKNSKAIALYSACQKTYNQLNSKSDSLLSVNEDFPVLTRFTLIPT